MISSLFSRKNKKYEQNTNSEKYFKIRSFTYYIPSPPDRKTGYQEKEFDQIFDYLMDKDFDIIEYKLQACSSDKSSGMWIMCLLGAKTIEAKKLNLDLDYAQIASNQVQHIQLDPSIEHDH